MFTFEVENNSSLDHSEWTVNPSLVFYVDSLESRET